MMTSAAAYHRYHNGRVSSGADIHPSTKNNINNIGGSLYPLYRSPPFYHHHSYLQQQPYWRRPHPSLGVPKRIRSDVGQHQCSCCDYPVTKEQDKYNIDNNKKNNIDTIVCSTKDHLHEIQQRNRQQIPLFSSITSSDGAIGKTFINHQCHHQQQYHPRRERRASDDFHHQGIPRGGGAFTSTPPRLTLGDKKQQLYTSTSEEKMENIVLARQATESKTIENSPVTFVNNPSFTTPSPTRHLGGGIPKRVGFDLLQTTTRLRSVYV